MTAIRSTAAAAADANQILESAFVWQRRRPVAGRVLKREDVRQKGPKGIDVNCNHGTGAVFLCV